MRITRRDLLKSGAAACLCGPLLGAAEGWDQLPAILARIQPPRFPAREFDITRFGAPANPANDSSAAIARAIEACSAAGGGRVVIPAGTFLTGPVRLKSNVNLHLASGATLRFSRDPSQYLPLVYSRFEGIECLNYSPFIYSDGQDNLAITGTGTLDGWCDHDHWWPWKDSAPRYRPQSPHRDGARRTCRSRSGNSVRDSISARPLSSPCGAATSSSRA